MSRPQEGGGGIAALQDALSDFGIRFGVKRITAGDELALLASEVATMGGGVAMRRSSGAARIIARRLLGELGFGPAHAIAKLSSGAPIWPAGVVGSLSHDANHAVAAVAPALRLSCLGIDIEPAEALPAEIIGLALNAAETRSAQRGPLHGRAIFSAKEAVYKAVHALDQSVLEYEDIDIRLEAGAAVLADGRRLSIRFALGPSVVVAAFA